MTTQQNEELPIVKMLEEKKELYSCEHNNKWGDYNIVFIDELLPSVRTLEQSSIDKAKEEAKACEKERIVKSLEQMSENILSSVTDDYSTDKEKVVSQYKIEAIEEAIELISNQ